MGDSGASAGVLETVALAHDRAQTEHSATAVLHEGSAQRQVVSGYAELGTAALLRAQLARQRARSESAQARHARSEAHRLRPTTTVYGTVPAD